MKILADRRRCQGYGNCVDAAPRVFALDDDGRVELLVEEVPPELREGAAAGVGRCPVRALALDPR